MNRKTSSKSHDLYPSNHVRYHLLGYLQKTLHLECQQEKPPILLIACLNTSFVNQKEDLARRVAAEIVDLIKAKKRAGQNCVLCLPTGSTPIPVYQEIVKKYNEEPFPLIMSTLSISTSTVDFPMIIKKAITSL
ncbi:hypothetical protein RCL1_005606 [Eukaryota sp. TZLM3-RCL]